MREQAPGANLFHDSVSEQAPSYVLKFALQERVSGASSLVCTEICFAGACFRSKLPCVYWLGYLPGSVFQEQAPSCVPALKGDETVRHLPRKFSRIVWHFLACSGEISVKRGVEQGGGG